MEERESASFFLNFTFLIFNFAFSLPSVLPATPAILHRGETWEIATTSGELTYNVERRRSVTPDRRLKVLRTCSD